MSKQVSTLSGAALDWAVAKCDQEWSDEDALLWVQDDEYQYTPSTDWSQGGPIIERERIQITPGYPHDEYKWVAIKYDHIFDKDKDAFQGGDTPLIAAMRCYVTSKVGATIEIPEELL